MKKPKKAIEHYYLGNMYLEIGEYEKAQTSYNNAIRLGHKEPKVYNNLAITEKSLDQVDAALRSIQKAIEIDPEFYQGYNNLGNILTRQKDLFGSIKAYQKAIIINPYYKDAYNNLGTSWHYLGDLKSAVSAYKKALELNPQSPDTLSNLGSAYQNQKRLNLAIKTFNKAIELRPNFVEAFYNLGSAYQDKHEYDNAISATKTALIYAPEYQDAQHQLIQLLKNVCQWEDVNTELTKMAEFTTSALNNGYRPGETPFLNISTVNDPLRNVQVANLWSKFITEHSESMSEPFSYPVKKRRKINIGYLSSDFRDHVIAHHMAAVFKYHDRRKFNIFAYSNSKNDKSFWRKYIEKNVDTFRDIRGKNFVDAAKMINKDNIDILVDLNGHTRGATLEITAQKPAPVQVTYLGFPGSTGATFFDYVITDDVITPPDIANLYTERFAYMPNTYQVSSYELVKNLKTKNEKFEIPDSPFIYCSFNNSYKISQEMFATWMNILKQVPKSVLWILEDNKIAKKNLITAATKMGVKRKRLVFAKRLNLDTHLKRLKHVHLALDTNIYNGGATTSNALYTQVPVITLEGETYISRMSTGLITSAGVPELITKNLKDYEQLAVKLGTDKKEYKKIKTKLTKSKKRERMFNTKLFTKNLEDAYKIMWDNHTKGVPPSIIKL